MKRLLPSIIVGLLAFGQATAELPPLWYEFTFNGGSTSNLFADSLDVDDSYGGIGVVLEQIISPAWVLWYQGYGETFAQTSDLGSLDHTLALETSTFVGQRGELYATALANAVGYASDYELYNRNAVGMTGGYRHLADEALRLRVNGQFNTMSYPNADTLDVDYREGSLSFGANVALRIPVSLDVEPGIQWRVYDSLDDPTSTRYLWLSLRASTPLTPKTGLVARLLLRDQLDTEATQLVALAQGGLDAGDMLWDGWQGGVTLNRMEGPWWFSSGLDFGHSAYAQSVLYSGQPARTDDLVRGTVKVQRVLNPVPKRHRMTVVASVSWTQNSSTIGYYTYDGFATRLALRISAE
ncbi:hypothetical protein KQI63_04915 [bacterium]|nr:hypothetical protein [bacterium]